MKVCDEKLKDFLWGKTIHSTNDISALEHGFRKGWKEALEWASDQVSEGCNDGFSCDINCAIDKELKD